MKIKAIVTGATGMVGEGVLLECLNDPDVEAVLAINRRPGGVSHAKLREVGQAMIKTAARGSPKQILEVKDIVALAKA